MISLSFKDTAPLKFFESYGKGFAAKPLHNSSKLEEG